VACFLWEGQQLESSNSSKLFTKGIRQKVKEEADRVKRIAQTNEQKDNKKNMTKKRQDQMPRCVSGSSGK